MSIASPELARRTRPPNSPELAMFTTFKRPMNGLTSSSIVSNFAQLQC